MKAIGIIGFKKSGKTTLLLKLTKELSSRGYQVAAVKHTSEEICEKNDSDTSKYRKYLPQVTIITPQESVIYFKDKNNLEEILKFLDAEIILIEGFKNEKTFPKIICLRKESEEDELSDGLQLCTSCILSSNEYITFTDFNILNEIDVKKIADIVIEKSFKLPNLNCGSCGFIDCYGLAREIVKGNKNCSDCPSLNPAIVVKVDGKKISMNPFIVKIVTSTIIGLLSTLKGFTKGDIEITIKQK